MHKIKIAIIAPNKYLETISSLGSCDMMLAHEGVKNEEYKAYFRKRKEEGMFVLMDNGAFEGDRVTGQELVDLTKEVLPSCVILPDVLGNYEETRKDTLEFHKDFSDKILELGVDQMVVPQWETWDKFLDNYKTFSQLEGVDYIGISYIQFWDYIPEYEEDMKQKEKTLSATKYRAYKRYCLIKYLVENNLVNKDKKHHLLGLADPYEYKRYEEMGGCEFIFSGDSALAYIMGKAKRLIDIELGVIGDREESLQDFNEMPELDNTQIDTIRRNVDVIKAFGTFL